MNKYALFAISFLVTGPIVAFAVSITPRSVKWPSWLIPTVLLVLSGAGVVAGKLDYWDVGIGVFLLLGAYSLAAPLSELKRDTGTVEFSFPRNWKWIRSSILPIVWNVAIAIVLFLGNMHPPRFQSAVLKALLLGAALSCPAYRDLLAATIIELRTTGIRYGTKLYQWDELRKFQWQPARPFRPPILNIPANPERAIQIPCTKDPAIEAILTGHGLERDTTPIPVIMS